ncbi:MAG: response regulator [Oceanobacter sp.]
MNKVLLVDDHAIFRSGLGRLISEIPGYEIAAEAASIDEAFSCLNAQSFDLVIMDINLGGQNALDHLPKLREKWPRLPLLIMSMYPAEQFAAPAYRAGANGYLSKDASQKELNRLLQKVTAGETVEHPVLADATKAGYPHERLSDRELEILKLIVAGDALTDIGEKMHLSVKTVSTYRSRVLDKLEMTNNAELIRYALTHGLTV